MTFLAITGAMRIEDPLLVFHSIPLLVACGPPYSIDFKWLLFSPAFRRMGRFVFMPPQIITDGIASTAGNSRRIFK